MQNSLFDLENRYGSLSEAGDPAERLDAVIDWEIFRPILEGIDAKAGKSAAGRRSACRILMFKLLVLQGMNGLSDERLQFQVTDRLSFMRFLGLDLASDVPDARTVWAFGEALKEHRLVDSLFERLKQALADLGLQFKSGQIIDATFVPVPIQRNSPEENAVIKAGALPAQWEQDKNKLAQKDTDARWTKKGGQSHYGYKDQVNIDKDTKLITAHACTDASVHDSQVLQTVLHPEDEDGKELWADSAYRSEGEQARLKKSKHESQIHERAYRGKPLSEDQKVGHKAKSSVRARVQHVFGHMQNSMGGMMLRTIGAQRARVGVALMNLTYKLKRIEVLIRLKVFGFARVSAPKVA